MIRLAIVMYILTATVFAGSAVIAVLSLKMMEPMQIVGAFAIGMVAALPVSLLVARNVYNAFNGRGA